jgi:hypothetical protein
MPFIPDAVPEELLDYDEIFRRCGRNFTDEDFALFKCPKCGRIYLIDYEQDTIYLDAGDLGRRDESDFNYVGFNCEGCNEPFPKNSAWIGPKAPPEMQVTWDNLVDSPWRWITERTR